MAINALTNNAVYAYYLNVNNILFYVMSCYVMLCYVMLCYVMLFIVFT